MSGARRISFWDRSEDDASAERTAQRSPGAGARARPEESGPARSSSGTATTLDTYSGPLAERVAFGPLPPLPQGEKCRLVIELPWGRTFQPLSEAGWKNARSALVQNTRVHERADLGTISLQCPGGTIRSVVQCTKAGCGFSLIEPAKPQTQSIAGMKRRKRRKRAAR